MKCIYLFLLICLFLSVVMRLFRRTVIKNPGCQLRQNGYCLLENLIDEPTRVQIVDRIRRSEYRGIKQMIIADPKIQARLTELLGDGYGFQDYIWIIEKSNVHTCHRDNNGDYFNAGQKHPSYTMLLFLEPMKRCLDVVPGSHSRRYRDGFHLTDPTKSVLCTPGSALLFNANLIHSGSFNHQKPNNIRLQFKVTHKDDLKVLSYYQDFNKLVNKENKMPKWVKIPQKHLSCQFPILNDLTQKQNIDSARGSSMGAMIGVGQKLFSWLFYGDKDYYDLKDIE